jgi:S-adenosylmethionine synthetase
VSYLFTSESVAEGHPDKVADSISDGILDMFMTNMDKSVRCACETLVTTNQVIIAGEYKGEIDPLDLDYIVRKVIKNIGYEQEGFHWQNVNITNLMHGQSADIALGTDNFGAGDQGLMFGYAVNETDNYMPAAIYYSHKIVETLAKLRKSEKNSWMGPDAKSQVTVEYDDEGVLKRIDKIVCSSQHHPDMDINIVRNGIEQIIRAVLPANLIDNDTAFLINPTGRFVIGGPDGDTGLTGRKIIVDTYGGAAPHGGGAFSGKDPTKVDRSAAYMARYLAKNIVASGKATNAQVQLSYAIGVEEPTSLYVKSDGESRDIEQWIRDNVDLTPKGIIDRFELFRPIYSATTNYGHFGKSYLPWEKTDLFG